MHQKRERLKCQNKTVYKNCCIHERCSSVYFLHFNMEDTPNINLHASADIDEEKVEKELLAKNIVWYRNKDQRVLVAMAVLVLLFCAAEFAFGIIANSLALLSDAFHMLSDLISLMIGFAAIQLSRKSASKHKSYGWIRAEVIGGLVNGVFLIAVVFFIILEAIQRFIDKPEITEPMLIIIVGGGGLVVNIIGLIMFASHRSMSHGHSHSHGHGHSHGHAHNDEKHKDKHEVNDGGESQKKPEKEGGNANLHAVFLHVLGDALGSIGAIASGVIIKFVDHPWRFYADPVFSLVLSAIILKSSIPLVKHCANVLLQSVPESVEMESLYSSLLKIEGIVNIHDLHVWQLSDTKHVATLHVGVDDAADFSSIAATIKSIFHQHGVHNTTIQPEYVSQKGKVNKTGCLMTCEPECAPKMCCETTPLVPRKIDRAHYVHDHDHDRDDDYDYSLKNFRG
eukprot:Phypoly_transcript_06572.p1 GENE.Phypoly_transcript_06572~~Phypoly_transcript_06572.p1  ORF type:complete len:453 (+),score=39.65 Phypoly_transcript_06572:94-1452(+)